MRIGIFIVTYNALDHIFKVIKRIPASVYDQVDEIFIVDDCSKDNTYHALLGYKQQEGLAKLTIHRNEQNQMYGGNEKGNHSTRGGWLRSPEARPLLVTFRDFSKVEENDCFANEAYCCTPQ